MRSVISYSDTQGEGGESERRCAPRDSTFAFRKLKVQTHFSLHLPRLYGMRAEWLVSYDR